MYNLRRYSFSWPNFRRRPRELQLLLLLFKPFADLQLQQQRLLRSHASLLRTRVQAARRERAATLVLGKVEPDVALELPAWMVSNAHKANGIVSTNPVSPESWFDILPVSMSARGEWSSRFSFLYGASAITNVV